MYSVYSDLLSVNKVLGKRLIHYCFFCVIFWYFVMVKFVFQCTMYVGRFVQLMLIDLI